MSSKFWGTPVNHMNILAGSYLEATPISVGISSKKAIDGGSKVLSSMLGYTSPPPHPFSHPLFLFFFPFPSLFPFPFLLFFPPFLPSPFISFPFFFPPFFFHPIFSSPPHFFPFPPPVFPLPFKKIYSSPGLPFFLFFKLDCFFPPFFFFLSTLSFLLPFFLPFSTGMGVVAPIISK